MVKNGSSDGTVAYYIIMLPDNSTDWRAFRTLGEAAAFADREYGDSIDWSIVQRSVSIPRRSMAERINQPVEAPEASVYREFSMFLPTVKPIDGFPGGI